MQSAYAVDASTPLGSLADTINLVHGGTFVVCSSDGQIHAGGMQGYYAADTRVLSHLTVLVDGRQTFDLQHEATTDRITVTGIVGDPTRPSLLVRRSLTLGRGGLTVQVDVENLEDETAQIVIELAAGADFADVFDVKRGDHPRSGFVGSGPSEGSLVLAYENGSFRRGLRITCDDEVEVLRDGLRAARSIPAHQHGAARFDLVPEAGRFAPIEPARETSPPWRLVADAWNLPLHPGVLTASCRDLESLLIRDPAAADRWVVAAGSPWFLTLFGRDSLITSLQAMPLSTSLAMDVLAALADRQGVSTQPRTDEQPGRILHEVRSGEAVTRSGGWGSVYYGTVDASPLFVITLREALRWGAPPSSVRALLPAAEAAVAWMLGPGDPDGDGFIEYPGRARGTGLDNQAWKDSFDAMRHRDGSLADGPIAAVEVQGYAHAALLAMADLHEALGSAPAGPLRERASRLRERVHEAYWMDDVGCFAVALDGGKRQVGSVTTNAGHLLWTGTAFDEVATRLADRLMEPDMFTGFGLRTLAATNAGYNPLSYHCGTVWPHDSAIVAAGMFRYGLEEQGTRLAHGLLDAARCCDGRLPELFGGFDRARDATPVPYPSSCSPQAWAAGAPLMLARHLLDIRPAGV